MPKYIKPHTFTGKILHTLILSAYRILSIFIDFRKKKSDDFEENPVFMSKKDILQLGFNYYVEPVLEDNSKIEIIEAPSLISKFFDAGNRNMLRMKFCGDIMPYREIKKQYSDILWDNIGEEIFDSDLNIANLETPISIDSKPIYTPEITLKKFVMNSDEEFFQIINGNNKFKGFDLFSTANNHSFDMDVRGLLNTIDFLTQKGIKHCGTFNSPDQPRFTMVNRNGFNVAFVGFTFSLNFYKLKREDQYLINYLRLNKLDEDISQISVIIRAAREAGAEFVVFLPHFGLSYHSYPLPHIKKMMKRIVVEAKPDLIVANHPHVPQLIELIDGIYCAYSLGDFIGYDITRLGKLSFILNASLFKVNHEIKVKDISIKPVQIYFSRKFRKLQLNYLFDKKDKEIIFKEDKEYLIENQFLRNYYLQYYKPSTNSVYTM